MLTREDVIWVVVLAVLGLVSSRFWGFDWPTTIVVVIAVSLGRLVYAWYARGTWRR